MHIFEPFVTYRKAKGTGLGMAMVKKIIDAHKGAISFSTDRGVGTIFKIRIPIIESS